jgi:hypothetical protein
MEEHNMRKGRRVQSVSVQPQNEDEASHSTLIEQHKVTFVEIARTGYKDEGRGAIVVQSAKATDEGTPIMYISNTLVQVSGVGWPDISTAQMIATYELACEFVVVFVCADQRISTYKIRLIDENITPAA